MAVCDPLRSVIILNNTMDSNIPDHSAHFTDFNQKISNSRLLHVEQTEPLDLCLNGSILNESVMVGDYTDLEENEKEKTDDDVIFVNEYSISKEKSVERSNGQTEAPRRNPVRQARTAKRFREEEYTDLDVDFDEDDGFEDVNYNSEDVGENDESTKHGTEDWKIENIPKIEKPKRRNVTRKRINRTGPKTKADPTDEKSSINELESIIESNLSLVKDYIEIVKIVNKLSSGRTELLDKSARTETALQIFKQQVTLLAVAKGPDCDLLEHITK